MSDSWDATCAQLLTKKVGIALTEESFIRYGVMGEVGPK